jgi:hypothetical protein
MQPSAARRHLILLAFVALLAGSAIGLALLKSARRNPKTEPIRPQEVAPTAPELTPGTIQRIATLFPDAQQSKVVRRLVAECGHDLPFAATLGSSGVERVQFAVLKISGSSLDRLRTAIARARSDRRDSLVDAGFAGDSTAHLRWLADADPPR